MKTKTQFTNRILSLVLAFVMVVGLLPMNAYAKASVTTNLYGGTLTIEAANCPGCSEASMNVCVTTVVLKWHSVIQ